MDLRQKVADAAVAELRVQLHTDDVEQLGTFMLVACSEWWVSQKL